MAEQTNFGWNLGGLAEHIVGDQLEVRVDPQAKVHWGVLHCLSLA